MIYKAAGDLTRHHIDDVASSVCVKKVRAFGCARPIAIYGPVRGYTAVMSETPDPSAVASEAVASGKPLALSISVHANIPRLGAERSLINVAELTTVDGKATYWFAAPTEREQTIVGDKPVLLRGQDEAPNVAVLGDSLAYAFQARRGGYPRTIDTLLQDLVAVARDRRLSESFPPAAVKAIATRQDLIAKSAATSHVQRLTADGASPLVVLRVSRDDLLGHADGPIAMAVADNQWAVRQPRYDQEHRIIGYAEGRDGVLMLAHDFGQEPTRLLCLDASKLEFAVARLAGFRVRLRHADFNSDPMSTAMERSAERETELLAKSLTSKAEVPPLASPRGVVARKASVGDLVR